ncbi:hypothetical protein [Psychrobacter sp. 16-MNA-CIBAN-0192]|uniref:hypothetical protein n=1 Tax=Psychrobacter sp. 16-MNA-CIBAN-0192 TaxID=3140448 RepID=UPI00331EACB6
MIKKFIFGISLLQIMSYTHAATDWTPELTTLQSGCSGIFHLMEELPNKYKTSIIKTSKTKVKAKYGGNNIATTYYLKNANAFGIPLDKIIEEINDSDFHYMSFSIVFKDNSFLKLRPDFYYSASSTMSNEYLVTVDMPKNGKYNSKDKGIALVYKNNTASGYDVVDESGAMGTHDSLKFDKNRKSITCVSH